MRRIAGLLLLTTLAGCGYAPGTLSTRASAALPVHEQLAILTAPASVRALRKVIKTQLEVHDQAHAVTVGDIDLVPSVIWNIFNVETLMHDDVFETGVFTYHVIATYDVLTKLVNVSEQTLIEAVPTNMPNQVRGQSR